MGIVTHIQRMSLHDGPGIRSTVFLKGCNMRCQWCHNPETFSLNPELEYNAEQCIHCLACVSQCSSGALSVDNEKLLFDKAKCIACFRCVDSCFAEAIQPIGTQREPEELVSELLNDRIYYEQSNGGITLSGGEPMMQYGFVKDILSHCKEADIHTAIETNLSFPWEKYEEILPFVDYVMVDLKTFDSHKHKKWTGVGNIKVIDNLKHLDTLNIPFEIRTPVVPGVNDNPQEIGKLSAFVYSLTNLTTYELLPFHTIGNPKYKKLYIENPLEEVKDLSKEILKELEKIKNQYH